MRQTTVKNLLLSSTLLATGLLAACSDNNNNNSAPVPALTPEPPAPVSLEYEVSVTNLTLAQPLSPLAIFIHDGAQAGVFSIGSPATEGLEMLAEGGDNSALLEEFASLAQVGGESPVGPGASDALIIEVPVDDATGLAFTLVTMLVNTNDAFTAVNGADIQTMAVGDTRTFRTNGYDAGTEANSESAGTIPGPADGGEGFNATRDDLADQVTMHPGVLTVNDGLVSSVLGQQHRWDNPVLTVSISRTR